MSDYKRSRRTSCGAIMRVDSISEATEEELNSANSANFANGETKHKRYIQFLLGLGRTFSGLTQKNKGRQSL